MASLSHHLLILLFISFFYNSINVNSTQTPSTACPSFDCGDGVTISYPFWQQNQQVEYCGYPGFNLSCKDQNPLIHFSDNLYLVKNINHSDNSLLLAYTDLEETNCPRISHDVTLPTLSLLNDTLGNKMVRFFYNCTLYPPSLSYIPCLQVGAKRSFVFMVGSIPEFDWEKYCGSIVTVPVIDKTTDGNLIESFGESLKQGFKLTWRQPDDECSSCEDAGGFCRYGNGLHENFSCVCADGRNSINCRGKDVVSIQPERSYVGIGSLIFGCLLIAATVICFSQKKKVALYKPVSNN